MSDRASAFARKTMRFWLPLKERPRHKALEQTIKTIRDQAIKCQEGGYHSSLTIFNIALYFLIAERDIQSLKIDALTHPDEWKRKLCARVILLTVHEWDLDKVSGTALKAAFDLTGVTAHLRTEAIEALRSVRTVQRRARKEFTLLRNTIIAHRDADALLQYQAIEDLNVESVLRIAGGFYFGAQRFIKVLPMLIAETSTPKALLNQRIQSSQQKP